MNSSLMLLGFALVVGAVFATDDFSSFEKKWSQFKRTHNKTHSKTEDGLRKEIFRKNHKEIQNGQNAYESGVNSHNVSHTHFSDLTEEEKAEWTGFRPPKPIQIRNKRGVIIENWNLGNSGPVMQAFGYDPSVPTPASVDLRTTGWNEPVQNQGKCGCCWAFSATTVFSQYYFKNYKVNYNFSQQNLIDCATVYGTAGCNGGSQANAFQYIQKYGQTLNTTYPFTGKAATCDNTKLSTAPKYTLKGFCQVYRPDLTMADQNSLKQAVSLGAVTVGIHANGSFFSYKSGVYTGFNLNKAECDPAQMNHAVTVIGYGTDPTTKQDYWLIKNSWGTGWGEGGYVRLARSDANTCGIYNYVYNICQ